MHIRELFTLLLAFAIVPWLFGGESPAACIAAPPPQGQILAPDQCPEPAAPELPALPYDWTTDPHGVPPPHCHWVQIPGAGPGYHWVN